MKVKINHKHNLWCIYCKEPIEEYEEFIEIAEEDLDGVYFKNFHYDCFRCVADEYIEDEEDNV